MEGSIEHYCSRAGALALGRSRSLARLRAHRAMVVALNTGWAVEKTRAITRTKDIASHRREDQTAFSAFQRHHTHHGVRKQRLRRIALQHRLGTRVARKRTLKERHGVPPRRQ